jgi:hypothetical protein
MVSKSLRSLATFRTLFVLAGVPGELGDLLPEFTTAVIFE